MAESCFHVLLMYDDIRSPQNQKPDPRCCTFGGARKKKGISQPYCYMDIACIHLPFSQVNIVKFSCGQAAPVAGQEIG